MLHIYGSMLSSPTNKVRYLVNFLQLPYEFHPVNLGAKEHRQPEFLKINPFGRIPAIDDNGFKLAESNAIIRYLAAKSQSTIYPDDLQQRALIDQWIDFSSAHVLLALNKIMFNTYFYKFAGIPQDMHALRDGQQLINQFLPIIENQLTHSTYLLNNTFTVADIAMLAALDVAECCQVDLTAFSHLTEWRKKLMGENFYSSVHSSYADMFNNILSQLNKATTPA